MPTDHEIGKIITSCTEKLNLAAAVLGDEFYYAHLPLAVIDAVFSMGVRYSSTQNVVKRFCDHFNITMTCDPFPPKRTDQIPITALMGYYNQYGLEYMVDQIYQNRQRTSTKNGILKAEAVLQFSQVLESFQVRYFQDVADVIGHAGFEQEIKAIPGQTSGICLNYFYMLVGSQDKVKADRMLDRFVYDSLGKRLNPAQIQELLQVACKHLNQDYPNLTPYALDHAIWNYQRTQKVNGG